MLCRSSSYGVLPAIFLFALTRGVASASSRAVRRGSQPLYYFDPGTTSYCSWWVDNDGTLDCSSVPDEWFITLEDFLRWVSSSVPGKYCLCLHCVAQTHAVSLHPRIHPSPRNVAISLPHNHIALRLSTSLHQVVQQLLQPLPRHSRPRARQPLLVEMGSKLRCPPSREW